MKKLNVKSLKLNNLKIKLIAFFIILLLFASSVIYTLATDSVKVTVTQTPPIDVVLTKARTQVNVSTFKQDLLNSLKSKGVDTSYVNIQAVESETVETAASFKWERDVDSNIGAIGVPIFESNGDFKTEEVKTNCYIVSMDKNIAFEQSNGKNIVLQGNRTKKGKNAIWMIPSIDKEQEFNFKYDIKFGDSFTAAGMLLRVQDQGNDTVKAYALAFHNYDDTTSAHTTWFDDTGDKDSERSRAGIWEITYKRGDNTNQFVNNSTRILKQSLNINTSGTLNVQVTDSKIVVSGGGLSSPATYVLENSFGAGYGFFSEHYTHSCDNIGSFALKDINLKTTLVKDFKEVLLAPEWRDGSLKALVNISDVTNAQLGDQKQLTEIITRLMNEDTHYIGWGTAANESEMRNTIANNDAKGTFISNANYSAAINATAEYIKTELNKRINRSDYIIANEKVKIEVANAPATNAVSEQFPNGKWRVEHDYKYFDNNEGQYEKSGIYTKDIITAFNKPGKYSIYYEDNLVKEIFAHRRPTASFNMQKNGNIIQSLTNNSSDLDTSPNNGIKTETWFYRKQGQTNWTSGKLSALDNNTSYIVKLQVTDQQGVSRFTTKYVATGTTTLKPIADFKITNKTMSVYNQLEVINSSYDPARFCY